MNEAAAGPFDHLTKEEYVSEFNRSIRDAIKEAQRLIALNTPMGFKDSPPSGYDAVGDEMDLASEHLSNALWKLRAISQ